MAGQRTGLGIGWTLHGDGRAPAAGQVVAPEERLSWPRTIGVGAQHVIAMFGATFLVPLLTGFPPATTLFFSGVGTMLFLVLTAGRVPSYLGSSFAFIAPIAAAKSSHGMAGAVGGIFMAGVALFLIGLVVQLAGTRWLTALMPPAVTGAIVALIGLNLAPAAKNNFIVSPVTALATLAGVALITVLFKGLLGRLAILLGVVVGYAVAMVRGEVSFEAVGKAAWIGLPEFTAPSFHLSLVGLFVPVVLVLVAENIGHVKSVALMTDRDLDPVMGRDPHLLHRGLLGGGDHRAPAVLLAQVRPAHRDGAPGRPRWGRRHPLRHDRPARRADLGPEPGRLRQPDQPHDRGHRAHHRHRRLHVEGR
jgi:NCS2 family nucleobase:cation symporter-2